MHSIFNRFLASVVLASSMVVQASDVSPSDELINSLNKINTYRAHFNQRIRDNNGEKISQSKGEMMVKRPGKFYWKSQAPDPILVIADGENLWTYDIELAQVTKQDQKQTLGNSPAMLLAGQLDSLKQTFKIEHAKAGSCQKSNQCYELKPKQEGEQFSSILIGFNQNQLVEIRMRNALGQDIWTQFKQVKVNQQIDAKTFQFTPPKGVDVIIAGT